MIKFKIYLIYLLVLFLFNCAQKTKLELYPNYYSELPISLLVIPPINLSTSTDASEYYSTTIVEPLSFAGYYVFPIELTNEVFKKEGIYDASTLENIPMKKFKEYFNADAVLFTKIIEWDKSYYVVGGNVEVKLEFVLKSTKSNTILWNYNGNIIVNTTSGDTEIAGLAGILIEAAVTALQTAGQDFIPIAKKINYQGVSTLPFGYYHPQFNKDQSVMIQLKPDGTPKPIIK